MALIDLLLNLAALLLWLNWRALRFDPLAQRTPATLVGTLKPAEPGRNQSWRFLAGVLLLLACRALLYWYLASPVDWTPKLDLGLVVLAFRNDQLSSELVFSLLSFLRVLLIFYFWLIALLALQSREGQMEPLRRLLRLHLGGVGRWPWPVQLAVPLTLVAGLWMALHSVLLRLGVSNPVTSLGHLAEQGLLVSAQLCLTLKYLLLPVLLVHVIGSYVYLGSNPAWELASNTGSVLLRPLQGLPLRARRLDFTPLVGACLVMLVFHWLPLWLEIAITRHGLSLWPQ